MLGDRCQCVAGNIPTRGPAFRTRSNNSHTLKKAKRSTTRPPPSSSSSLSSPGVWSESLPVHYPEHESNRKSQNGNSNGHHPAKCRSYDLEPYTQVHLGSGFPIPTTWGGGSSTSKPAEDVIVPLQEEHELWPSDDVVPVFRISPYVAELHKVPRPLGTARIMFLDEGNACRSVLAEAILNGMLEKSGMGNLVEVESASIGPTLNGAHDSRVAQIASEMGIRLLPRQGKIFDEVNDIVNFDIVIVMDRFDHEEVFREVVVLDTMNPGGFYSSRIKMLGEFCLNDPDQYVGKDIMEIDDPMYGICEGEQQKEQLASMAKQLTLACNGLLIYLKLLKQRSTCGLTFQSAVIQSLQCPLIDESARGRHQKMESNTWRPVWRKNGKEAGDFFTIRYVKGDQKIVKRVVRVKARGYWSRIENVDKELKNWMEKNECENILPLHTELQKSGNWMLSKMICRHGGFRVFKKRLKLATKWKNKKVYGYWRDIRNVLRELQSWMEKFGKQKEMPTTDELVKTGHASLATSIVNHGGFEKVASKMGLKSRRPRSNGIRSMKELLTELSKYMSKEADGKLYFPTHQSLQDADRIDLISKIRTSGGSCKLAQIMGVNLKRNKFRDVHVLAEDIKNIIKLNANSGDENRLLTAKELKDLGREDLIREIRHFGGFAKFAEYMGLEYRGLPRGKSVSKNKCKRRDVVPVVVSTVVLQCKSNSFL